MISKILVSQRIEQLFYQKYCFKLFKDILMLFDVFLLLCVETTTIHFLMPNST